MTRQLRIGMVAGEASGDALAAGTIKAILKRYPDAIIEGIGGEQMQDAGFDSLYDMEVLSVMGLVEVMGRLPAILNIKKALLTHFSIHPPDVFVGIDAPDFNLRIEKTLKAQGIPTVHYVSPSVWAWREKRINKIAKATSLVMGIFPFEADIYEQYKVPYKYVGHSLADAIPIHPDPLLARQTIGLDEHAQWVALLPGSRTIEVASLLPVFLDTMVKVQESLPELKVVIPAANKHRHKQIQQIIDSHPACTDALRNSINLVEGYSREAMIASDAVLLASGTASLEAMLCKRPMVVAYKMSSVTHKIMKRLYKPKYFALPNILAGEELVPELLQEAVNAEQLSALLLQQLNRPIDDIEAKFTALHQTLKLDADERSAAAVLSMVTDA